VINAVGPWNVQEIAPKALLDRFNGYIKGEIVRVSEARDLGDINRYEFYEATKTLCAAPPDILRCNEKYTKEFYVPNVCGLILTSNYRTDGIYLPDDDRRHFVAWSDLSKEDFTPEYWNGLWHWYQHENGFEHVAAWLQERDISKFDAKAPEDAELADVLDRMGNPDATTLIRITAAATGEIEVWIRERKNRRLVPHRLEKCGYVPVRNNAAKDGLWKISGTRQVVYAQDTLSIRDRHIAASRLAGQ
jgi:hypothetical protein